MNHPIDRSKHISPTSDDFIEIAEYPKGTNYVELGSFFFRDIPTGEVPIPSAVWLFGSGLLGLVGVARRRKSS